jgi:hypothetical protein
MRLAGLYLEQLTAAHIVEFGNQSGVSLPTFWGAYLFHIILFPQTAVVAECADATFGTYAGTGQNNYFLHVKPC